MVQNIKTVEQLRNKLGVKGTSQDFDLIVTTHDGITIFYPFWHNHDITITLRASLKEKPAAQLLTQKCRHFWQLSSLAALEVVKMTTSGGVAYDENFVNMATFLF